MTAADFLPAILADPDDDTPRAALADWLQEQGDARGDFIAVQLEYALLDGRLRDLSQSDFPGDYDRWANLRDRLRELFPHRGFVPPLPFEHTLHCWADTDRVPLDPGCAVAIWRRGFIDEVRCSATSWLAHAAALTAVAPIRAVTLTTWPEIVHYVMDFPFGIQLRGRQRVHPVEDINPDQHAANALMMLEAEWPGIAFTLPGTARTRR